MAVHTPPKTGYEKWQYGIDGAVGKTKWNVYDCEIQAIVNDYNRHLLCTPGYRQLDW